MFKKPKYSLSEEDSRSLLREQRITPEEPGTILRDVAALLEAIGLEGVSTSSKQGNLPSGMPEDAAAELDDLGPTLATHPAVLGMRVRVFLAAGSWASAAEVAKRLVELMPGEAQHWIVADGLLSFWRDALDGGGEETHGWSCFHSLMSPSAGSQHTSPPASPNQMKIPCSHLMALFMSLASLSDLCASDALSIRVHVDQPTVEINSRLYGLFYEDINYAADGGLYAELVQNRSFEYFALDCREKLADRSSMQHHPLYAWEKVEHGGGSCELKVERTVPLNRNNLNYLAVYIDQAGDGVGVRNLGYGGIRIDKGESYDVSLYAARWGGGKEPAVVSLESADGKVYGSMETGPLSVGWKKFKAGIKVNQSDDQACLTVTTKGIGKLYLDMASVFPQKTFKNRKNGLRPDLAQALLDLNPKFVRFPGGCIAHGCGLENTYQWKDTVGDVAERRANWNRWGYHQTYGLGYYEYFLLCEDLGAAPLPVVPVGVSCGYNQPYEVVPLDELQKWIDDALDLVEFANGPVDSKWGKVRAEMGHPEPFGLQHLCLGNEEHDTPQVRERIPLFVKAIREAYPEIKLIGTSGLTQNVPLYPLMKELNLHSSDEHYYNSPEWYVQNQNRFDGFDRNGPRIFVGEYASQGNTMFNAVAEAAYLTGIERNADIVDMACYAPLFAHVNHTQWTRQNLIWFDKRTLFKTPNYYVQQLFSRNKGDVFLKNEVVQDSNEPLPPVGISATLDKAANEVILKLVNPTTRDIDATVHLNGISGVVSPAMEVLLTGGKSDKNSIDEPERVAPSTGKRKVGTTFDCPLPAISVQVIRIGIKE